MTRQAVAEISNLMAKEICEMLKGKPLKDDEVERVAKYLYRCSTIVPLGWAIIDISEEPQPDESRLNQRT